MIYLDLDLDLMYGLMLYRIDQVMLAELKTTGDVFAIKMLKKDVIIQDDDVEAAITERNVLTYGSCPFLVELHSCFQTPVSLTISSGGIFNHKTLVSNDTYGVSCTCMLPTCVSTYL